MSYGFPGFNFSRGYSVTAGAAGGGGGGAAGGA